MALTREEADFLRDRIVAEHPSSLLAWLTLHGHRTDVSYPWEHPLLGSMTPEHRRTLDQARIFSAVMVGAPILYNRMVSEELERNDLIERYQLMHDAWVDALALEELRSWSLDELFRIVDAEPTHSVTPHAKDFIRRWVEFVRKDARPRGIPSSPDARRLVHARERRLKGARSLFRNRRAREELYRGDVGLGRMKSPPLGVDLSGPARLAFQWDAASDGPSELALSSRDPRRR